MAKRTNIPLNVAQPSAPRPISRAAKWRVFSLVSVHILMLAHIVYWLKFGSTITPVEPSESMETLKTGAVNAGFIFFALAILLTLIFGRFVCGWACHFLAYQDLCGWLLKRMGIQPKPLRSRLLMLVPLGMAIYMFAWPVIYRWCAVWMDPVKTDYNPPWTTAFVTEHFWETFPGWIFAILTFTLAGFSIVYFLGNKGFCTYACPYGGVFVLAETASPYRVRVNESCVQSGVCTTVCGSNVSVAEEVFQYGMVVDPGCMKCADCITSCPTDALSFGFGSTAISPTSRTKTAAESKRSFWTSLNTVLLLIATGAAFLIGWGLSEGSPFVLAIGISCMIPPAWFALLSLIRKPTPSAKHQPETLPQRDELILAAGFLFFLFSWWGLYGNFPFLMSAGIAAIFAFVLLKFVRMLFDADVSFQNLTFKQGGKTKTSGKLFLAMGGVLLLASSHNAVVQYHGYAGAWHFDRTGIGGDRAWSPDFNLELEISPTVARHRDEGIKHLNRTQEWGVVYNPETDIKLTWLHMLNGDLETAEESARSALDARPDIAALHTQLARVQRKRGEYGEAILNMRKALEIDHSQHNVERELGQILSEAGHKQEAYEHYKHILEHAPNDAQVHYYTGALALELHQFKQADQHLRTSIKLDPNFAPAREQLGLLLLNQKQTQEAIVQLKTALKLDPNFAKAQYNLAVAHLILGDIQTAKKEAEKALQLDPNDKQTQEFLKMLRQQSTQP